MYYTKSYCPSETFHSGHTEDFEATAYQADQQRRFSDSLWFVNIITCCTVRVTAGVKT